MARTDKVELDTSATLRFQDGAIKTFYISFGDAVPERGIISFGSPLAQALLGHAAGERISYRAAGKILEVDIIEVTAD